MKRSDFIRSAGVLGASLLGFRLLSASEAATSVLQLSSYPTPLPETGALSQAAIFDYFKGAMLDVSWNPEAWPYTVRSDFFDPSHFRDGKPRAGFPPATFPMNRGAFYNVIDLWSETDIVNQFGTLFGQPLYTYAEAGDDWPVHAVNDWAKIKSVELGLFGSIANGSGLSDISIVGSGTFAAGLEAMTVSDLYLLRHALVKFETYGECHDDTGGFQVPAPTGFNSSVSPRNFSFSYAPGYSSPGLYEFSVNGGGWQTVTGNPQSLVNFPGAIPSGAILLRTASSGIYEVPSNTISNNLSYPAEKVYVYVSASYNSSELTLSVMTFEPLNTTIVFEITILNNFQQEFPRDVTLLSGQTEASEQFFGSFSNVSIYSVGANPPWTSDGREIEIIIM